MGHKVHPYGFRLGINKPWLAKWYADQDYATLLQEDMQIRAAGRASSWPTPASARSRSSVGITRSPSRSTRPSRASSSARAAQNVELLRNSIGKLTGKKVKLKIKEILQPELDAVLVAQNVADQLERRIAFRKAIKQSVQRTIKAGAKGVKIQVSGRLGGAEMCRTEWDSEGRIPLGTLRADISYGVVHAHDHLRPHRRQGLGLSWATSSASDPARPRTEPREPRQRRPSGTRTRSQARPPRSRGDRRRGWTESPAGEPVARPRRPSRC